MALIAWNSTPDYDEFGIDTSWTCSDWTTYHKKLVEHFGKKTANEVWDYAFAQSTNLSSNLDCNSFNANFREYVKKQGLKANNNLLTQVIGAGTDVAGGAIGTTSNVALGIFDTVNSVLGGKNLKRTLSIVLVVGGIIGVAYVYKAFKK